MDAAPNPPVPNWLREQTGLGAAAGTAAKRRWHKLEVMAAIETRLLILGAVMMFEPVNGYQVLRELRSWDIEEWAKIKPGSIYSVLRTLTKNGSVIRHEVDEGARTVSVYVTTAQGRAEFHRLFSEALREPDAMAPIPAHTAWLLLLLVTREDFLSSLDERIRRSEKLIEESEQQLAAGIDAPEHIIEVARMWHAKATLELEWSKSMADRIRAGEFAFAGEPLTWQPPPNDPGWQMMEDQQRYRSILGLDETVR